MCGLLCGKLADVLEVEQGCGALHDDEERDGREGGTSIVGQREIQLGGRRERGREGRGEGERKGGGKQGGEGREEGEREEGSEEKRMEKEEKRKVKDRDKRC